MPRLQSAGGLAAVALALPLLAHAACQVETLELPVKMVGSRAVATVGINGTQVPLTVDSGAFYSFLTEAAAAQLGLPLRPVYGVRVQGVTGSVETSLTTVDKLQLLGGDVAKVEFAVGGNEPGAGTMGLMGRNLLSFTDTEYDLAHGVIRFMIPNDDCAKSNMAYWAGTTPVTEIDLLPERAKNPAIRARVTLNGYELTALFDTGATTIVSTRAARRAGVAEADMKPAGTIYGAGRGIAKAWTARFGKFELGGEAVLNNTLDVADFKMNEAEMLLGVDFFLSHRIYVSKKQSKMYLTYSGGTVFALNKSDGAATSADAAASGAQAASADELARRGAASASRREFESALADLDRACALEPTNAAFLTQRGAILLALGRPAKALEDLDKALELDPAQADARLRRASMRLAAKNREGTIADLDVLDKSLAPQAQMRLAMAGFYTILEQPAQVLVQLNHWLPAHANEVRRDVAFNQRCRARLQLGIELDKALEDCDNALDTSSKNPVYLDSRGWLHLRMGNYRKALSDFDRSLEVRPSVAWSLYGRGLARTRLGDAARADADLTGARNLDPDIDVKVKRDGLMTDTPTKP